MKDNERLRSPGVWREYAALMRRYGMDNIATIFERCAEDIEAEERERASSLVTLEEAVEITGFSRSHLRRLWRTRKVRAAGTEQNPEFYPVELPRKAGYTRQNETLAAELNSDVNFRKQVARAVVKGEL